MRIHSLTLKNIRSYEDETIAFPEGKILLSGDIGSGKTSILLAVEFALFGILRGSVSGSSLLRHGCTEGSVELTMEIEGKEVTIQRNLKGGKAIKQEAGCITIDGNRMEGTAIELKSKILGLIGYPDELLTKSKSLIYRYTVYTPQEEMKEILYEPADERLNTIRGLFNIDKYRRIKDNTIQVSREIRHEKDELSARAEHYVSLKKEFEEKKRIVEEKREKEKESAKELLKARNVFQKRLDSEKEFEEKVKELEHISRELAIIDVRMKGAEDSRKRITEDIEEYDRLLEEKPPELPDVALLAKAIKEKEEAIKRLQEEHGRLNVRKGEISGRKSHAEDLKESISRLDHCPTCLQKVTEDHKAHITAKENDTIKEINRELILLEKKQESIIGEIASQREFLKKEEEKEKDIRTTMLKVKTYEERLKKKNLLQESLKKLEGDVTVAKARQSALQERIGAFKDLLHDAKEAKRALESARDALHRLEIEETRIKTEIRNLEDALDGMKDELSRLEAIRDRAARLSDIHHWLSGFFYELIDLMERQILLKVYHEFNTCFQDWFSVLIEDEGIQVRLSEDFSPIIEENGYETLYDSLSGGEKTSIALAYRLALFRIVNDFIGDVKTKDLLILDEPTDGFSTEQLDRVRDVLQEIKAKQVIIVSHEQKMESFVEHIIRVVKDNHVSKVV